MGKTLDPQHSWGYNDCMNELQKRRKELDLLHPLVNSLNIFKQDLPAGVFMTDLDYMMREINYLRGFVDAMIKFEIPFSEKDN